jgi:hypothetical protein
LGYGIISSSKVVRTVTERLHREHLLSPYHRLLPEEVVIRPKRAEIQPEEVEIQPEEQLLGHTLAVMVPINELPSTLGEFCRRHNPPEVEQLPMLACLPFRITPPLPGLSDWAWEACVQVELGKAVSRTAQAPSFRIGFGNRIELRFGTLPVLQEIEDKSFLEVWSVTLPPTRDQVLIGLQEGITGMIYECEHEDRMVRRLDLRGVVPVGELILAQGVLGRDRIPPLEDLEKRSSPFGIEVNALHWLNISTAQSGNGSVPETPLFNLTATSLPFSRSQEVYLAVAA